MLSKRLSVNITARVLLILFLSVLFGFLVFKVSYFRFAAICGILILISTVNLISFLNQTNRNIKFFFDSVKNNDSNLSFSLDNKNGNLKELHISMNRVNQQIEDLKVENRQQEQFFQKILELLATAIITYDSKGFIHHANSAAKKLLAVDTITHISQLARLDKKFYSTVRKINPAEKHLVAVNTRYGEINLSIKSTISGKGEDALTILSIQDIKNELDEKELDAWMKLIRVLMHEIMNSIAPITSLSESLQKVYKSDDRIITPEEVTKSNIEITLRGLEAIREQGKGLMHFVESFRKLSSIPRPEKTLFNIARLFNRVEALVETIDKKQNTHISFSIRSADYDLYADENLISQVLINLIRNAIEANVMNQDCQIRVTANLSAENSPEICVSDNGPGIPEENIENIFVPFFTTRRNGSGIGLSLSRQIIGMHGGTLTVRSLPGKETVFCMRFLEDQTKSSN
jgi:two-component system, NtrC family, nitrogen regulation sensor histidine kinase NtrY